MCDMYYFDQIFYFKRTTTSEVESRVVTTESTVSEYYAKVKMTHLFWESEKGNNPSILLGSDIKEVSSLWV